MKEPVAIKNSTTAESEHARRFGGIARLYGDAGLARIAAAKVCVIGIGGVGSWVVESLARSAVGSISMIDMDIVATSNINRQLLATTESIGRDKVLVMQDRVKAINPQCRVKPIDDFITPDNLDEYVDSSYNFVIDCIDDFRTKAALISHCKRRKIKIFTVGGAGGQVDPAKVVQTDLSGAKQDVLLARTRKLLRQEYGFSRDLKKSFSVPCVYSNEQLVYPDGQGGVSAQRPTSGDRDQLQGVSNALNCAGGIGSVSHVTASFGLFAVGYVLNKLTDAA